LFDSSVAVDSVLLDFEGRRIQMGFCFQEVFGKQSRQAKLCVNHSAISVMDK
jgi:hypothetical protein